VLFYQGLHKLLEPLNPLGKFVTVKAVVFFSYWQSLAIAIAVANGYITQTPFYDTDDVARAVQNWLICVEMFLASLAHRYSFSYTEYSDNGTAPGICRFFLAFFDSTIPLDFVFELGALPSLYRETQNYSYQNVTTESDGSDELDGENAFDPQNSLDDGFGEILNVSKSESVFSDDKKWKLKV
jgi:hypothetical protein